MTKLERTEIVQVFKIIMTLLKQCFCYSLRQGAFIIGSYSLVVYCIAFAVELWWIVEALLILPAPAYTLCALYFFNFIMAAVLIFGLLIKQRRYLMSWSLMTVLSFFPEAGMVLFMSLYYWPTHKYEYGVIELVYWSLRAIFNIFGALCVCSLYLSWRDEELILCRLHDLTLASIEAGSLPYGLNDTIKSSRKSRVININSTNNHPHQGYPNYGYLDGHHTTIYSPDYNLTLKRPPPTSTIHRGSQSFSTHPLHLQKQNRQMRAAALAQNRTSYPMKNEFNPSIMFDPAFKKSCISELGIAGIGVERPGIVPSPGSQLHRTRSLWNVSNDEYWARPPPSRPVSMGYVNHILAMENQNKPTTWQCSTSNNNSGNGNINYLTSMDRRKNVYGGGEPSSSTMGRRATSMDGLNHFYRYYGPNIIANHNNHFSSSKWNKSSMMHESEQQQNSCNYRDIEL